VAQSGAVELAVSNRTFEKEIMMSGLRNRSVRIVVGVAGLLLVCVHGGAAAGAADDVAQVLLAAASPYEDMVGPALAGDDAGLTKMLSNADGQAGTVRKALPPAAAEQFDELLAAIHKSVAARDHYATAEGAVRVFKLLVDNVPPASLKVPREVSLMDYAGFKLQVLAAAKQPDWEAMRKTASEASASWNAIKGKVSDKRVRDTVNSTIAGMERAAKAENLAMIQFAAEIDLDLVDVLEGHFEGKH
jgi:hypothetical protein